MINSLENVAFVSLITMLKGSGRPGTQSKAEEKKEINNKKFYELLGVDQKATLTDIKRAFRKKAIREHPDKGGDPDKV